MSSVPFQSFEVEERSDGQKTNGLLSNAKTARWFILFISCVVIFGDYYCYDTPYSVKFSLRERFPQYDTIAFNYLFATMYAAYDLPNVILPMINGYFASKIGNRKMMTVFLLLVLAGSFIFTIGISEDSFAILIVGRFVYGLGGDSLIISQWSYIAEYFGEDKIGIATGFISMFMGISESSNLYISPMLVDRYGLVAPFHFTTLLCISALIGRIGLFLIEKTIQKGSRTGIPYSLQATENQQRSLIPTREDFEFPRSFYMVIWFGITALVSYFGFFYLAYDMLETLWFSGLTPEAAQNKTSFYTLISSLVKTFAVVIMGYLADTYKWYSHFSVACPIILSLSFILSTLISPMIPFLLFGIGGALSQISLWSSLSNAVGEEKKVDYLPAAVLYSLLNMLFAIIQYTNTFFFDITGSHNLSICFYVALNIISLVGAIKHYRETRQ